VSEQERQIENIIQLLSLLKEHFMGIKQKYRLAQIVPACFGKSFSVSFLNYEYYGENAHSRFPHWKGRFSGL
jgi:hypothetical protein